MKNILTALFVFASTTVSLFAQGQESGTFSFQLGYDIAVHGTLYRSAYNGLQLEIDSSAAVTTLGSISAQYNLLNWFSAGVTFDYGKYVEDTADVNANGNHTGYFTLDARLYPVNGNKFNLYVGPELGFSFLEINKHYTSPIPYDEQSKYNGLHFGLNAGFNWYFVKFAGIFMQFEYTRNNFRLHDFTSAGTALDLTNWDVTLDTFSGGMRMGLCFKID